MRGHENVVEVAVFVPSISLPAVRDLVARVSKDTEYFSCFADLSIH